MKSIVSISQLQTASIEEATISKIGALITAATVECIRKEAIAIDAAEREYLEMTVSGLTDHEISDRLGITIHGVRKRKARVVSSLSAKSLPQAIKTFVLSKV